MVPIAVWNSKVFKLLIPSGGVFEREPEGDKARQHRESKVSGADVIHPLNCCVSYEVVTHLRHPERNFEFRMLPLIASQPQLPIQL